jgi:hypothetical protein
MENCAADGICSLRGKRVSDGRPYVGMAQGAPLSPRRARFPKRPALRRLRSRSHWPAPSLRALPGLEPHWPAPYYVPYRASSNRTCRRSPKHMQTPTSNALTSTPRSAQPMHTSESGEDLCPFLPAPSTPQPATDAADCQCAVTPSGISMNLNSLHLSVVCDKPHPGHRPHCEP